MSFNKKEYQEQYRTSLIGRYNVAKGRAKYRNLDFIISFEEYVKIIKKDCHYCLGPLDTSGVGLDRMDNSKGYLLGNVLPCCGSCNTIKGANFTVEETKVMVRALMEYRDKNDIKQI